LFPQRKGRSGPRKDLPVGKKTIRRGKGGKKDLRRRGGGHSRGEATNGLCVERKCTRFERKNSSQGKGEKQKGVVFVGAQATSRQKISEGKTRGKQQKNRAQITDQAFYEAGKKGRECATKKKKERECGFGCGKGKLHGAVLFLPSFITKRGSSEQDRGTALSQGSPIFVCSKAIKPDFAKGGVAREGGKKGLLSSRGEENSQKRGGCRQQKKKRMEPFSKGKKREKRLKKGA